MPYTVETVRVVSVVTDSNPNGYIVINKSDVSPDHVIWADRIADEIVAGKRSPGRPRKAGE